MEGEKYRDGSVRVNEPCAECDMSYLLEKNGILHCNRVGCKYTKAVDTTEHV